MSDPGIWQGLSQATGNAVNTGMRLMEMTAQNQLARDKIAIAQQEKARRMEISKAGLEMQKQHMANEAAKIPQHLRQFDPGMVIAAKIATKKSFGDSGLKVFAPVFDTVDEIAKQSPGTSFGDAYEAAKSAYPAHREQMISSIEKELTSGKLDPNAQKQYQDVYNAIAYDKTGDRILGEGIFKNTARSMKMEEENSKSAIQAARDASSAQRLEDRLASNERNVDARIEAGLARAGAGKTDKQDKTPEKETKSAVTQIEKSFRGYEANIKKYEIAAGKAPEKEQKWYQDAIDKEQEQLDIARNTRDSLLNGEITPNQIQWGGGRKQAASGGKDKHGYVIGEVRQGHRYVGDDRWEEIK